MNYKGQATNVNIEMNRVLELSAKEFKTAIRNVSTITYKVSWRKKSKPISAKKEKL